MGEPFADRMIDNSWYPHSDSHSTRPQFLRIIHPSRRPSRVHRVWQLRPTTPRLVVVQTIYHLLHWPSRHEALRLLLDSIDALHCQDWGLGSTVD